VIVVTPKVTKRPKRLSVGQRLKKLFRRDKGKKKQR
jgi:hypothetical protein